MNEARSSGPVIDRDSAAALMEPLTELVIRAGAAILSLDRAAMKIDGKADGSPVTESRTFRYFPRNARIWRSHLTAAACS